MRLSSIRLEGSRIGLADIGLEVTRFEKPDLTVQYHLILRIVDTSFISIPPGPTLAINPGKRSFVLARDGIHIDIVREPRALLPNDPDRYRGRFLEIASYPITAAQLIQIARASEAEFKLKGRNREVTRFLRSREHDQVRAFVVYHVKGAPIPVTELPG